MRPCESRNATSSSPSSLTRTGAQSGSGSSRVRSAGIQYRRIASPMGVPRPTRVTRSFSSRASMLRPSSPYQAPSPARQWAENLPKETRRQASSKPGSASVSIAIAPSEPNDLPGKAGKSQQDHEDHSEHVTEFHGS